MNLADLTWPEARDAFAAGAVALLPVGATEAHQDGRSFFWQAVLFQHRNGFAVHADGFEQLRRFAAV